jgi:hypothetical protein
MVSVTFDTLFYVCKYYFVTSSVKFWLIPHFLAFSNVLPADDVKTEEFKRTRY